MHQGKVCIVMFLGKVIHSHSLSLSLDIAQAEESFHRRTLPASFDPSELSFNSEADESNVSSCSLAPDAYLPLICVIKICYSFCVCIVVVDVAYERYYQLCFFLNLSSLLC